MGRPVYSRDDEVIRMEDADFEERTNSALAKAAAWLARPALLKQMTERMVWPLAELREQTAASLSEMLKGRRVADSPCATARIAPRAEKSDSRPATVG